VDGGGKLRDSRAMTPSPDLGFAPPPDLPAAFAPPAGMTWGRFAAKGAELRWGHLAAAAAPRANCIIAGGFGEFVEKYYETMGDLARMGFATWCFDWRGQGRSTRPRTRPAVPLRRDFDQDADDLIAFTGSVLPHGPRFLIAHSMGGGIAMLALSKAPDLFAAAALSSPMLGLHTGAFPRPVARLAAAVGAVFRPDAYAPGKGAWAPDPHLTAETALASHDPQRCKLLEYWYAAHPELRVDGATYGWVKAAFAVTDRVSDPRLLARVATPVLIGAAQEEHFVDPAAAARAAGLLPHGTLLALPGARHELFLERDDYRSLWLAALERFISTCPTAQA
jgi:lysophospholipase